MDHQYHQPLWPLFEGAYDYTMNLAAELWSMIWKAPEVAPTRPVCETNSGAVKREESATGIDVIREAQEEIYDQKT